MPACLLILTLDQAVTQYGQLLFGIFNLSIVTGKLSIVSNQIDNISKLPGTKKSTKYREEIFILNYLNLLLTKRIMIIPDVYLFMPVNLSF